MKTLFGAIALFIAAPAAAQAAPAPDSHAGHSQHQQGPGGPSGHKMDCKCCDQSKEAAQKKDCCADHAAKDGEHSGH